MTTTDIAPSVLASVRDTPHERVVVKTRTNGWQLGRRYEARIMLYNALGRLTITDTDEVYHSMLGSVLTYNLAEAQDAERTARQKADGLLLAAVTLSNDLGVPLIPSLT